MLTPQTHKQLTAARKDRASRPTPAQLLTRFEQQVEREYTQVTTGLTLTSEQEGVYAELAANAVTFTNWVDGDPFIWQPPTGYTSLLITAVRWLQGQQDFTAARAQALAQLRGLWRPYLVAADQWDRLRTLWSPPEGDEFGPLSAPASTLPLWDASAAGQTVARWECYCGVLAHLNQRCGLALLDLTDHLELN